MRGLVEVAYLVDNEVVKTTELESNMIVDLAGKTIADAMTITPSLADIASASAILDTSNYTIQAIAFGKPAASFTRHAHSDDVAVPAISEGGVKVITYQTTNVSSYHASAHPDPQLSDYPTPEDTRLENGSTETSVESENIGHNRNVIFASAVNGLATACVMAGCWAASESAGTFVEILDEDLSHVASAVFRSAINEAQVMDQDGYLNMVVSSVSAGDIASAKIIGLIMKSDGGGDVSSPGADIRYIFNLSAGDYGMPNLFGGIYTLGLYTIDMPATLATGVGPPFEFDVVNNQRKYRLFAKKVFTQDITTGVDFATASILSQCSTAPIAGAFTELVITWRIRF